jgi:hypothetical protein
MLVYEDQNYKEYEFDSQEEAEIFAESVNEDWSLGYRDYLKKWVLEVGYDPDSYVYDEDHEFNRQVLMEVMDRYPDISYTQGELYDHFYG